MSVIQDVLCIGGVRIIVFYVSHMLLVSSSEIAAGLSDVGNLACVIRKLLYTLLSSSCILLVCF